MEEIERILSDVWVESLLHQLGLLLLEGLGDVQRALEADGAQREGTPPRAASMTT